MQYNPLYEVYYLDQRENKKAFETLDLNEAYSKLTELRNLGYTGVHIQQAIHEEMRNGGKLQSGVIYSDDKKQIRLIDNQEVYYYKKNNLWHQLNVDENELKLGMKAELEHKDTLLSLHSNPEKSAKLIALDHLIEDKHYYSKLSKMENQKFDLGGVPIDMLKGKEIELKMPNGEKRKGQFAIVELYKIKASHNENTFSTTEGYPVDSKGDNINDRNYKDDKNAQAKVIEMAQNLEPEILLTTSRTPSGSPIITESGIVVSGNNRTMSLKRAFANFPQEYNEYVDFLVDECSAFGFTKIDKEYIEKLMTFKVTFSNNSGETKTFTQPVLVRIDYDIPALNTLELSKYNKDTKKTERPIDKSIKLSKILESQPGCKNTIQEIVGQYDTLSEFYQNYNDCKKVIDALLGCNILNTQELPAYVTDRGFTEQGKDLLENTLLGSVLSKDALVIADEMKRLRNMLVTSLPVLSQNDTYGDYSLVPDINEALILENTIKSSKLDFKDWLVQYPMFEQKPKLNVVYMNRFLQTGRNNFKQSIERYNNSAKENQGTMLFGEPVSKQELFDNFVKNSIDPETISLIEKVYGTQTETKKEKQTMSSNIFSNGDWYKEYPAKVLATTEMATDRYGKSITTYKGTLDNVDMIDAQFDIVALNQGNNPLISVIDPDIQDISEKNSDAMNNIEKAIAHSEKAVKEKRQRKQKIKSEEKTIATSDTDTLVTRSIEEVYNEINKDISKEEVQAFLWFNLRYGKPVQNEEWYSIAGKTMADISTTSNETLIKWMELGYLCYNGERDRLEPTYLYLSGDVYGKYNRLSNPDYQGEKDLEKIKNEYGEKALEKQIELIKNLFQKQYENRLIIDSNNPNSLIILPNSSFAKDFYITTLSDEIPFKWKKITAQSNSRYGQFDFLATYVSESDKREIDKLNLTQAFCYWLRTESSVGIKKGLTYADIINYYIFNKQKPKTSAEKEFDGTYSSASKKIMKEESAIHERMKAKTKAEGDRLFLIFLDKFLLFNDKVRLETEWNMRYNNNVPIDYSRIPVAFRMNKFINGEPLDVRPEKREAVAFTVSNGSGLLAYDVGVGKTPSAIFTVSQFIDLGWCKRPLFVVPNQTYKQWISEFKNFAGHLKINKLYNLNDTLIEEYQDTNGNTLQVGEQTITIMTYEGLSALGFNDDTAESLKQDLTSILLQEDKLGSSDNQAKKELLRTNTKVEEIIGKALRKTKLGIEDLGIDYLCIDEAHACKKVFTFIAGSREENTSTNETKEGKKVLEYKIQAGKPSFLAIKGFSLCQYIQNKYAGNTQLLTATPFTNSPLEIYSMLAMVSFQELQRQGLSNLKEFFDTFIKISYEIVINTALNPVRKQVVLGFNNLLVLQRLVRQFINHKTGESVNVKRPKKYVLPYKKMLKDGVLMNLPESEQVDTAIPLTPLQKQFMDAIKSYAEGNITKDELASANIGFGNQQYIENDIEVDLDDVEEDEDSLEENEKVGVRLLLALNHARNLALSPYLYQYSYLGRPTPEKFIETSGKLSYVMGAIKSIKKHHEKTKTKMSGIVIYSERGTDFFELIREYLITNLGFKPNEVGIISAKLKMPIERGIKDEDAKEYVKNLFLGMKFNKNSLEMEDVPDEERIKVLIGSATIKEGINLQKYSSTLFNCFLPFNPTDVQQLEGRIYRQGNAFANVRIVNPLMIDSSDIFMFQKLEEKTSRINSVFDTDGKTNVLKTEELNPQELKYALIKNPKVIAQFEINEKTEVLNEQISDLTNDIKKIEEYRVELSNLINKQDELDNIIKVVRPSSISKPIEAKLKALANYFSTNLDENGKYTAGYTYRYGVNGYRNYPEEVPKGKEKSPHEKQNKPHWFGALQNASRKTLRFEKDFLIPRGLKIGLDSTSNLTNDIQNQINAIKEEIKSLSSPEAIEQKVREIEMKRAELNVQEKTIAQLIKEFEKLNYLLDDVKLPSVQKVKPLMCPPLDENGVPRIDPEGLSMLNDCIKQQPQTKYTHSVESKNEDGTVRYTYTESRLRLHQEIIDTLTDDAVCIEQDKPIAVIMGGAPGSGKSTFLKNNAPYMQSDMIWKVDADEVRSMLPEYKGWNASTTHEETRDIVNELLDSFDQPCKHDLLYDGTMSNTKKYLPIIKRLKRLGYQTFLVFMDIPKEKSIERALNRYRDNNGHEAEFGRYVPIAVIDDFYSTGDSAFQQLKKSVDGYIKVDSLTQKVIERGGKQIPETRPYYQLTQPKPIETKVEEKEVTLEELKVSLLGAKSTVKYLDGKDKKDVEAFIKGLESVIKYMK